MINNNPNLSMLIIVGSTFFTIFLFIMALLTTRQESSLTNRLRGFTVWRSPQTDQSSAEKKNIKQVLTRLADYAPAQLSKKLDKQLLSASIPLSGGEFIVLQFLLTIIFFIVSVIITRNFIVALCLGIFGYVLPQIWIKRAQRNKKHRFNDQLIDALLIIANSLKAGFSFLQAMDLVSKEMTDPIAGELQFCLREMNYGTPTEEALQNLSERVGSDDLDLLITAILIQRQVGGNLAEVLQNIHSTLQDRIRIKREIKTLTAQGRISGFIIAALPFGIAAVLLMLNPDYLKLLITDKIGWVMLAVGLALEVVGFLAIRKIISIKV